MIAWNEPNATMEKMTTQLKPQPDHHYYFVTGKLAETALREIVTQLSVSHGFTFTIGVMPITVAALMTPRWLRRHLNLPSEATHIIVPGYCHPGTSDLENGAMGLNEISGSANIPVICGPKDCRALPELFGEAKADVDLEQYDIDIIAEINHAPRQSIADVVRQAKAMHDEGADGIDFGCDPASRCLKIGDYIMALVDQGLTVSVDTFDSWEAAEAVKRGASLVLSVNSTNRDAAVDWGCEVVVIPDSPQDMKSFHETVIFLSDQRVTMRFDPILEPIGTGFANSLVRYAEVREAYPTTRMMMGIGNLTELTDADSAAINLMLLGICQELRITSVLTTQVIPWARSSVRECDLARRMVHYSIKHGVPPKRLSDALIQLRDPKLLPYSPAALDSLAKSLKDNNYRIFSQDNQIHLLAAGLRLSDDDPFALFEKLMEQPVSSNVDAGHAFYLGFEMAKASIALLLGKQYEQDQALRWGHLTKAENHHRIKRTSRHHRG